MGTGFRLHADNAITGGTLSESHDFLNEGVWGEGACLSGSGPDGTSSVKNVTPIPTPNNPRCHSA